jgi:hypothetical protein
MKTTLTKLAGSQLLLGAAILLVGGIFLYLRSGGEYFLGTSGGAYWDNMTYCGTHRDGQMKVYSKLVPCREILTQRKYCRKHLDDDIVIDGTSIACDKFLGVEDDHSPYDAY